MKESWTQVKSSIEAEVSSHAFNTWIRPLTLKSQDAGRALIEVPNRFYRDRIRKEYADLLVSKLREFSAQRIQNIDFVIRDSGEDLDRVKTASVLRDLSQSRKDLAKAAKKAPPPSEKLNPKYRFESFVVGHSNQFANAAALAVAQGLGQTYNPLFLYGGVGLGKTHILCAIGNHVLEQEVGSRVVYRTAEKFMNELINAIRYEKTNEFRAQYRDLCDVLLIDDVQFLAGKERTQEEFFHTFNALYEAGKQIVVTSDQFPQEISGLDERLRSRFEWGLLCDIQPPDVETRMAILKKKAEESSLPLPDDVALFLAGQFRSNVRQLEGSLVRLAAFASISSRPISLELTKEIFQGLADNAAHLTAEKIQKKVAEFFHIKVNDLRSNRRHRVIALPRQVAMYLCRKLTELSFPEIGQRFGGKDHTTVMHGVSKIESLLERDSALRNTILRIEEALVQNP